MDKNRNRILNYLISFAIILTGSTAWGISSAQLETNYEQMREPTFSTDRILKLNSGVIEQKDFSLYIDSGTIYLFDPISIDGVPVNWGGVIVGGMQFRFEPSVPMEREQLRRFYNLDSLSSTVREVELIAGPRLIDSLIASATTATGEIPSRVKGTLNDYHKFLVGEDRIYPIFEALKGIAFPSNQPFLLVNTVLGRHGQTIYRFNPYDREEVSLRKHYWEFGSAGYMELVCSYSVFSDGTPATINGLDKAQIKLNHYNLNTRLEKSGEAFCDAIAEFETVRAVQMIELNLNPELIVDSVAWLNGNQQRFRRWTDKDHKSSGLYLFLDRQLSFGEKAQLRVWSHGKLLPKTPDGYIQITGGDWYPYYENDRATFEMKFVTPERLEFVASGDSVFYKKYIDSLVTTWKTTTPVRHVSFAMGAYDKYELDEPGAPAVDIYFDKMLHVRLQSNHSEEKVIAQDLINCLKLFSAYYGPYQYPKLVAAELLGFHGQSFPGMVHLGFGTFDATDKEGYNRLFRAHEVAHQWWGLTVDDATYHDTWLVEGLAEYTAMMYVQASTGNKRFFDILDNYSDTIFGVRQYPLGSGAESGPIALGARTSSTETAGDYRLVVYKKGAFVFHMLRNLLMDLTTMSDQAYLDMMADWYRTHKGRQVTTLEFIRHVSRYTGEDMNWFFKQFVYGSDLPTYHFSYELTQLEDGRTQAVCHISQEGVPEDFKMYIPLEIEFVTGQKAYLRLMIDQPEGDIELPPIEGVVKGIRLNPFQSVLCRVKS